MIDVSATPDQDISDEFRPGRVTLADGREVSSDSREWLYETEAAYVLALPTIDARRQFLDAVEKRRKEVGRKQLEDRVRALWLLRKGMK